MSGHSRTQGASEVTALARNTPEPGLRLVFSDGRPRSDLVAVPTGGLVLGRQTAGLPLEDAQLSREHARVDASGGELRVHDLGSRNGTFVDGMRIRDAQALSDGSVLRLGRCVFLVHHDVRPLIGSTVTVAEDMVAGPALAAALGAIARAAKGAAHVLIRGESGSGKELGARAFHRALQRPSAPQIPLVAVNCAAIPPALAESLLFGARKGAFSGAVADANGLVADADGGVLFLDEVAELDRQVQAKLLRVLETKEVLALGASRPRRVDVRICSATLRELRQEVAAERFREDLYHRLAGVEVVLPPLRARREEIAFLVARQLAAHDAALAAHPAFIESCLLLPWPGNIRTLLAATREAASRSAAAGSALVRPEHLPPEAGAPIRRDRRTPASTFAADPRPAASATSTSASASRRSPHSVSREDLESCLRQHAGNVSAASRALGLHRTQTYRLIRVLGLPLPPAGER